MNDGSGSSAASPLEDKSVQPSPERPVPEVTCLPEDGWSEGDWGDLLDDIQDGTVIPVIGPELLTMPVGNVERPIYAMLAEKLATKLRLPALAPGSPERTVNG